MSSGPSVAFLNDYPVELVVELGRTRLTVGQIAELAREDVIDLDRTCDQPLNVFAGGRLLARGELVRVGDRLSLRVVEVVGERPSSLTG